MRARSQPWTEMTDEKKSELKVRDALRLGKVGAQDVRSCALRPFYSTGYSGASGQLGADLEACRVGRPVRRQTLSIRKVDYKGVYAKGRFVRIESASRSKAKPA